MFVGTIGKFISDKETNTIINWKKSLTIGWIFFIKSKTDIRYNDEMEIKKIKGLGIFSVIFNSFQKIIHNDKEDIMNNPKTITPVFW